MTEERPRTTARAPSTEEHFRLLVESVRDYAIFLLDASGHVASWNAGARSIKGYTPDEIIGRHLSVFYTEPDRAAGRPAALLATAASEGRVEDEGWRVRKDGSRFWADVVITALRDAKGELIGFAKVTRDLTERRSGEERLRTAEEMLEATLYSIGDAVLATDELGNVTLVNPVGEKLTGWKEEDAIGRNVTEVFRIVNEDSRREVLSPVARVLQDGLVVGLANHTALIARDGTERPIADSGAPIRDAEGRTRGAVLIFRDVSEERRAEEERLRLAQSQESVRLRDEFLSIASHELKTPLTALQLQLRGVFERVAPVDDAVARKVEKAMRAGERLGDLIETLLDVSRIATGKLTLSIESFDLVEAVREVVDRLSAASANAECEVNVRAERAVLGTWDRLRVEQVVTNLLANALKYAPEAPVEISVESDGATATLRVRDHGEGLPEGDVERLFDRFERASAPSYGGLGLGLYIASQVCEAHGGTIRAETPEGRGACFVVRLPLAPSGRSGAPRSSVPSSK